jgi:DNA-binding CsgD family transcriptional regulator
VIAYVHGDSWGSAERQTQLAELFGLTHSEARLTLVLSRGTSPTNAAKELGLSIETIRSYTKVIYSKTGARGIADLVRIVMRSVLAFAPDR